MLKTRMKKQAAEATRAATRLVEIHASIAELPDEDLLDLADIFAGKTQTALGAIAATEMQKRNLKL